MSETVPAAQAVVKTRRKISTIWLIPIIALISSIWIIVQYYVDRGPEIRIEFTTAEGIEAGKTQIKALNVEVGIVERVELNDDLETVSIFARIDPKATDLLRQDTQFWVVKPRIGSKGISGLSTLLSGAYIELAPGQGYTGIDKFVGLDSPPLIRGNRKGIHVTLSSDVTTSLSAGDPVMYRGFRVGQVNQIKIVEQGQLKATAFIREPYDKLVTTNSRFFNASGFKFELTPEGMEFTAESMETILSGGVAFDVPTNVPLGQPVDDGYLYKLYKNQQQMNLHPYQYSNEYLLLFDSSTRGLMAGAPVEYRGIPVGTVQGVSFEYLTPEQRQAMSAVMVPVIIKIDAARILGIDTPESKALLDDKMRDYVTHGLRAALKNASLVTGKRIITLDYYPELAKAEIQKVGPHLLIPSTNDDLDRIITRVGIFVDKLNELPINQTLNEANTSLAKLNAMLISADKLIMDLNGYIGNEDVKSLPKELKQLVSQMQDMMSGYAPESDFYQQLDVTLKQLTSTLRSVDQVTTELQTKPNSLIFAEPKQADVIPGELLGQEQN
ncbi:intermembrane transport protein PqiB [Catenovulum sp. SM1970]|uniref:intermembrane transport protein PqiB n=1 Tax=Marinifaba aquimaris TaxID=2741323 RepID=UPI0015741398|nr:intermembrane transport protein PqiB [Marinifaba aquimaris]NTS75567.1 intermembrane transport protein PqiB [Marinifaba aquimaris]